MSKTTFISIIVPIYNTETYLRKCLNSICNQSYTSFEVLLVNDGSSDTSGLICDEYVKKDNRFHAIHKLNEGVSVARNVGVCYAQGEWVTFVDSDDWLEKDALETLVDLIDTSVDLVVGGWMQYDENGLILNTEQKLENKEITKEEMMEQMLPPFCGSTYRGNLFAKLFKREIITTHYIAFNSHILIGEDRLFNVEYIEKMTGKTKLFTRPLYSYLVRCNSAMSDVVVHKKFAEKYLTDLLAFRVMRKEINWANHSLQFQNNFYQSMIFESGIYRKTISPSNIAKKFKLEYALVRALGFRQTILYYGKRVRRLCNRLLKLQ